MTRPVLRPGINRHCRALGGRLRRYASIACHRRRPPTCGWASKCSAAPRRNPSLVERSLSKWQQAPRPEEVADRPRHDRRGRSRTSVGPIRLGREWCPVRVAEEAGVGLVRIGETQFVVLPERLGLAAWAVRARAVQRGVGIVIQSRERAPRLAPDCGCCSCRFLSPPQPERHWQTGRGPQRLQRRRVRIVQCVGAPSANPPTDEVGLAIGIRHESGDRSMGTPCLGNPPVAPATPPLACIMANAYG